MANKRRPLPQYPELPSEAVVREILRRIGDDPNRDGLLETPARVVKSWGEIFSGYKTDPLKLFKTFEAPQGADMVTLEDIEFFSTCEHHMIPFFGRAHIGYIPDGKVIGVSKLARLLEVFARRLQIQERLGREVAQTIMKHLRPQGVGVVIEAKHLCVCARGVGKQHSFMRTSSLLGSFRTGRARDEFLAFVNSSRR